MEKNMAQAVPAEERIENVEGKTPEVMEDQSAYSPEETRDNIPPGTRVKVIINPASGKKAGITTNAAGTEEVRRILEANGIEADVVETEYAEHATELTK